MESSAEGSRQKGGEKRMFYGEFYQNIDDKGRVIIPAKYRPALGSLFYITKDLWNQEDEKCLYIYPQEAFDELREKLRGLSKGPKNSRALSRAFYASVQDSTIDKQGRVLINADLKEHAELKKEIVFVGVDEHIEVWDKEKWIAYNDAQSLETDEQLAESLGALGI